VRIGIDSRTLSITGGPRTYTENLVKLLPEIDGENEYVVFYNKNDLLGLHDKVEEE